MKYKVVLFDLGGVVCHSPFEAIADYEEKNNIPHNFINICIKTQAKASAFAQLETNSISLETFYAKFKSQLEDPNQLHTYYSYLKKPVPSTLPTIKVDTKLLLYNMSAKGRVVRENFISAIQSLRKNGLKTIAVTNNFALPGSDLGPTYPIQTLFDHFIESKEVGLRKPDPRIYKLAIEKAGCEFSEAIFLDDIGMNLKSAAELGIETIKVSLHQEEKALQKLSTLTSINFKTSKL
eukprot:maker-scaffold_8-snap-gene-5.8-mRNA-1 protein AED:0.01 eAED:0.01 QI:278/1/1/1/0/0/3/473/235